MNTKTARARLAKIAFTGTAALLLAACASMPHPATADPSAVSDPLEPVNRVTMSFNRVLDKVVFNPLDTVYRTLVPQIGRDAVHNVLANLKSPVYLANELLQGDLKGAGTVVQRFMINTFVGGGGLVDVAAKTGMPGEPEDFGQTLAVWGVGNGPYIVWPILGPSTLRDSAGFVGDIAMDPIYWYARNTDKPGLQWTRAGLTLVDAKDRTRDVMDDVYRNSGDPYAVLKSIYIQRRNAMIDKSGSKSAPLPTIE
ncbi:MAG: VacJ family lipoprotein [Rhodospirillales bacterium]|nr:VacJ family lipoprotein [Alphaproteobacteria bacterium]MCB9986758.1 VacJ family lipoprotein [Rhodospirillales bacterium]USO08471.1 MAG: VacJ family lipoprotein [Rhodospirillales bacterium]